MNKYTTLIAFALLAVGAFVFNAFAQSKMYPEKEAVNKARAQVPVAGAPADTLSPTAASDASTQMNPDAVYMFTCSEDAHVRWCDTSSCTAVATDFLLTSGTIIYFATGAGVSVPNARYVAAIRDTTNGTCYINEVR